MPDRAEIEIGDIWKFNCILLLIQVFVLLILLMQGELSLSDVLTVAVNIPADLGVLFLISLIWKAVVYIIFGAKNWRDH